MEIWKAIVVGIVQGLAEFLPISSSGHIVLTQFILGIREVGAAPQEDIAFEVVLHLGTLVSVLIYFRKRLWDLTCSLFVKEMREERMMILWLGVATLPAVIAYKGAGDWFKAAYNYPVLVSGLLIVTGLVLYIPRLLKNKHTVETVGCRSALVMGVGQALAILPGISRSGSTIASGMVAGVNPAKAAEFSFLMSIPAIAGGMVVAVKERAEEYQDQGVEGVNAVVQAFLSCFSPAYLSGAIAAAVVGLLAIYLVLAAVRRGRLELFSWYCFAAGIAGVVYFSAISAV
ncbi:undecaprenyl-diphosphate phosphatase [Verrucomicrobiaceae bacterium N1E253]|uniref:Undecaprenyl-diphosphatase n=1 Tax=Oceaniferula marina TaxID=2748318 RepID=A0A851GPT5_9BACT|nr:undecaprenyl-diphosphate phosphatase [Oceaniferula marina]NWK57017.1 undecaprenyl-diphosphate phosphatase [Oceaniferula marina]